MHAARIGDKKTQREAGHRQGPNEVDVAAGVGWQGWEK